MRWSNRILYTTIVCVAACQQVEMPEEPVRVDGPEFTAKIEAFDAEAKTALEGNSVVWLTQDQIAVFQGTAAADKYQVDEKCVGTTQGRFSIVAKGESPTDDGFDANIAVYPYQDGLAVAPVVEDGKPTAYQIDGVVIPSVQTYTANTFSNGSFLMAAVTDDLTDHALGFKNLCGALKLQLKGTCKVKTISLQGNDGELLSGDATVTMYPDGSVPTLTMGENASAIVSVHWIDGVQLNAETATSFFITVPPTSFEKGFTVKIVDIMGAEALIQTSKANAVGRSYVHTMPEVTIETVYPSVDVNALSGLSIACIGDSITQGVGAEGTPYPSQLATRLNATVKNLGVSGSSLCEGGARTCNIGQLTEANCAGKDVVTILMGVNDWAAARNNASEGDYYHLGDINARETNTIRGAMRMWCDKIQELRNTESCANTKFYFMTPTITSWNSSVTKTRDWDQSKTNVHGFTLRDLCHAIIDVATEYDIPVIDLNICSGIYYNSPEDENVSLYGGDGVHINGAGHTLVTDAIIRALYRDLITSQWHAYETAYPGALSICNMYRKTPLYTLPGGQDGFIHKGLSFQGNGSGTITIRDVQTGTSCGTMKWDKVDLLKPHDNSVSKNVGSVANQALSIPWTLKSTYSSSTGLMTSGTRAVSPKLPLSDYSDFIFTVTSCTFIVSCYDKHDAYLGQVSRDLAGLVIGTGQWLPAGTHITKDLILSAAPDTDHISLIAYNNEDPTYEAEYSGDILYVYSNVYNSYASQSEKHIGECCVYEVHGAANVWANSLVQVLKVGFINDLDHWPAASESRPYGNFLVDEENECLYVYVMYSSKKQTYWYKFDLPDVSDGVWDEGYDCYVKILDITDVKDQWTTPLQNYVQGACVHDGLIWSTEGFSATSGTNLARMRIIDPSRKSQIAVFNFYADGDPVEPEFIDFYNGRCYYGSVKQMYMLELL